MTECHSVTKMQQKLLYIPCRLSAYWLGWSPTTFYRIYTAEAFVLFTLRWALYRIKKWHYYLFDFCYVANVLLLLHLWVFPHSAYLHKVRMAGISNFSTHISICLDNCSAHTAAYAQLNQMLLPWLLCTCLHLLVADLQGYLLFSGDICICSWTIGVVCCGV